MGDHKYTLMIRVTPRSWFKHSYYMLNSQGVSVSLPNPLKVGDYYLVNIPDESYSSELRGKVISVDHQQGIYHSMATIQFDEKENKALLKQIKADRQSAFDKLQSSLSRILCAHEPDF